LSHLKIAIFFWNSIKLDLQRYFNMKVMFNGFNRLFKIFNSRSDTKHEKSYTLRNIMVYIYIYILMHLLIMTVACWDILLEERLVHKRICLPPIILYYLSICHKFVSYFFKNNFLFYKQSLWYNMKSDWSIF
jgi:hypothetical protein